jgi:hypothetical protein
MGDTQRAQNLSNKFTNRTMQAVALYAFDKCGNCVHRMKCANDLLATGGVQKPIKFVVDGMIKECPKKKYNGVGIIPREVGGFLNGHCSKCDKIDICIGYVVQNAEIKDDLEGAKNRLKECSACPDLPNCIQYYMQELKISKFGLMKKAFVMKFRNCYEEDKSMTSLDLPIELKANVGGKVGFKEKV